MATDISRHRAPATLAAANTERQHHKGRKPFSSLMKRLVSLKNHTGNSTHTRAAAGGRAASCPTPSPYSPYYPYKAGKYVNSPPPPSSSASAMAPSHVSFGPNHHGSTHSISSTISVSEEEERSPTAVPSERSRRPAPSAITATTATTSIFSSPTPSVRSLTTTLTTIQSTAPGSLLDPYPHYNPHPHHHHNPHAPPMLFQHQFPTTNPASPGPITQSTITPHPINYSTATAGGLLTDNASIITLASSSKHRRRHSLDTDASVRALAPSSLWGGSRESLPLSVLSGNFDRSVAGERASLYGATSFTTRGDASSMRDFALAGGSGSIMGELSGASGTGMMIAGNRESTGFSRRSSAWVESQYDVDGLVTAGQQGEQEDETEDDDTIDRRRSLSVNGDGEGLASAGEGQSMRDGSSNVGVWHGVFGHKDGEK